MLGLNKARSGNCEKIKIIVEKFCDILMNEYQSVINDVHLMEDIFSVKKSGMINPHMEKFRDFF